MHTTKAGLFSQVRIKNAHVLDCRATFALIMTLGLEAGIFAGIIASTVYFAFEYARSQVSLNHFALPYRLGSIAHP